MSNPTTPISRMNEESQSNEQCNNETTSGTGSWFEIIGGVMGELIQNWSFLSALRRRGWGTTGSKSTSNLSPFDNASNTMPEYIELSHFGDKNPLYLRVEGIWPGKGHDFRPTTLERPSWCDACAHLIFYHALTCHNCSFTCHEQCQKLVSLDCKLASSDNESLHDEETLDIIDYGHSNNDNENDPKDTLVRDKDHRNSNGVSKNQVLEDVVRDDSMIITSATDNENDDRSFRICEEVLTGRKVDTHELTNNTTHLHKSDELSTLRRTVDRIKSNAVDSSEIEDWLRQCPMNNVGLQITKENDGGYRGCIRIHLNLCRPINIVAGTRPPSIYDVLQEDRTLEKTLTSFYMPRDAVKAIHINNKTTTREVIAALLKKFKVVDNPQKFALYERTYDAGQSIKAKLRRLSDSECPLVLAITWNAQRLTNKRLVLQENDTADIQWEAFSLPELDNFLRILDKEEMEYKNQIRDKYKLLKLRLGTQLSKITASSH